MEDLSAVEKGELPDLELGFCGRGWVNEPSARENVPSEDIHDDLEVWKNLHLGCMGTR